MTEATWNDEAKTPEIDWRMSASLENVPRGENELAEVTSLEGAVRAWLDLDDHHQSDAILTLERPLQLDGALVDKFIGSAIGHLAERLPSASTS
ncbi:hypothetical protein AB2M62_03040 [Sphingomonas sp. MMS12-HWE2-04]|uniref:hypothetical protein n=1 Tax=Sphingomonas sp. MMS12-HWE2-04 TaxID=3234199 RepID=UPI003850E539